jgi:hypothetical protein
MPRHKRYVRYVRSDAHFIGVFFIPIIRSGTLDSRYVKSGFVTLVTLVTLLSDDGGRGDR